jgi:hypothetical protein
VLRLKEERVKIETEKDVKVIREIREELRKGRVVEESKIEESMETLDVKEDVIEPKERLSK